MQICDNCQDPKQRVYHQRLYVERLEAKNPRKRIVSIPFDICDKCMQQLAQMLQNLKNNKWEA